MLSLDEIIHATEQSLSGPRILNEQHDTGAIDWLVGLSDPGEMIACGYMQEARRRHGESDEDYAARLRRDLTPEQWEELRRVAMPAALRRASLDTSNGRVACMVAGKAPWHKLGVNVAAAVNSSQALALANLAWSVSKRPLTYDYNGNQLTQDEVYAIVRDDTGAMLGAVGNRYKPIQNSEGFDFLDSVLADYGARYETAGAAFGGRKVWMECHLPRQSFTLAGNDRNEAYAIFQNVHDGSGQAWCFPTSQRVVCANTYRVASQDRGKGISMRHTGNIQGRIQDAQASLGIVVKGFEQYREAAEVMSRTNLPVPIMTYANDVLDTVLEVTAAQSLMGADVLAASLKVTEAQREFERKALAKAIDYRKDLLADILDRYESETCGVGGMRGTVWSGFNAITEAADYKNGGRKVGTEEAQLSRKMESVISGERDDWKQSAYTLAASYLSA